MKGKSTVIGDFVVDFRHWDKTVTLANTKYERTLMIYTLQSIYELMRCLTAISVSNFISFNMRLISEIHLWGKIWDFLDE